MLVFCSLRGSVGNDDDGSFVMRTTLRVVKRCPSVGVTVLVGVGVGSLCGQFACQGAKRLSC